MTPAEVARQLGMEQVTVRAHLFKARRAIRTRMLEQHERMLKEYRIMNCTEARDAMLVAEAAELRGETETTLAAPHREMRRLPARCGGDSSAARLSSGSRSLVARREHGDACHAARLVWCLCPSPPPRCSPSLSAGELSRDRAEPPRVSLSPLPVARTVSLEVGRGQQATVLKTADPKVTVIWLSSGEGK